MPLTLTEFVEYCNGQDVPVTENQVRHAKYVGYVNPSRFGMQFCWKKGDLAGIKKYLFGQRGPQRGRPRGSTIGAGAKPTVRTS